MSTCQRSLAPSNFVLLTLTAVLLLNACGSPNQSTAAQSARANRHAESAAADVRYEGYTAAADLSDSTPSTDIRSAISEQERDNPILAGKQLVVSASAAFEVNDVQQTITQIETLTRQSGGYVADSKVSNDRSRRQTIPLGNGQEKQILSYVQQAEMVLRIPKAQVTTFLQTLSQQVAFLKSSQFSAEDVTLDIQRAQIEAQIQAIKAKKLDHDGAVDAIDQAALAKQQRLYAELEQKAIQDQVLLSTIELQFSQPARLYIQTQTATDAVLQAAPTENFGIRLQENLQLGWRYFLAFVLELSKLWLFIVTFIALIGFGVWLIRFLLRRSARRHASKSTPVANTAVSPQSHAPNHPTPQVNPPHVEPPQVAPPDTSDAQQDPPT